MKISCAIVGLGFWGQVFLRKILSDKNFELKAVVTREVPEGLSGEIRVFKTVQEMAKEIEVDFVFILTSVNQHLKAAKFFLKQSKNIFLTKPITLNIEDARELKTIADKNKCHIFVDHTFLFNPDFLFFKKLVNGAKSLTTQRTQFGRFQKKSDVFGECLYHDIYMSLSLFGRAKKINALATKSLGKDLEQCYLEIEFAKSIKTNLSASMAGAFKQRMMSAVLRDKIITWQDMAPSIFTEANYKFAIGRDGNVGESRTIAPPKPEDAIQSMLMHVFECLQQDRKSKLIGIENGIEVMRIIDLARKSVQKNTAMKV